MLPHMRGKVAPLHKLHHKIVSPVSFTRIVGGDDVGMGNPKRKRVTGNELSRSAIRARVDTSANPTAKISRSAALAYASGYDGW